MSTIHDWGAEVMGAHVGTCRKHTERLVYRALPPRVAWYSPVNTCPLFSPIKAGLIDTDKLVKPKSFEIAHVGTPVAKAFFTGNKGC